MLHLCSNTDNTCEDISHVSRNCIFIEGISYHKLVWFQRYRSSWTLRSLPYRDHQFRSGQQRYAERVVSTCIAIMRKSTYANDAQWANQLNVTVLNRASSISLGISLEVSKITYMANLIGRSTVGLAVWVD